MEETNINNEETQAEKAEGTEPETTATSEQPVAETATVKTEVVAETKTDEPVMETKVEEALAEIAVQKTEPVAKTRKKKAVAETVVEETATEMNEEAKADETTAETKPEDPTSTETTEPEHDKNPLHFISSGIDKLIKLKDETNFTDFWFYVKELNTLIFNTRGLPKEDRMKFKDRISELCDDAKKLQDDLKAKVAKTSKLKLEQIDNMLKAAMAHGNSHEEMEKSFAEIEAANKFLREGIVKAETGEESADMSRNDKEKAKDLIKQAREAIFDKKRALREGNFKNIIDKLNHIADKALNENPRSAFNGIKNLRTEMKDMTMDRGQFKEINDLIDTIWKKAIQKIDSGRVYDQKKKTGELDISLKRKTEFIEKLEQEVRDLTARLSNVRGNDFFSNRMKEQIEEKKEKIENTKKEIESVKEKIVFMKQKEELK